MVYAYDVDVQLVMVNATKIPLIVHASKAPDHVDDNVICF